MAVSENEIGLREARAQLGELVNKAQYSGVTTYITRHGRRVAVIAPFPQERTMTLPAWRLEFPLAYLDALNEVLPQDDGQGWTPRSATAARAIRRLLPDLEGVNAREASRDVEALLVLAGTDITSALSFMRNATELTDEQELAITEDLDARWEAFMNGRDNDSPASARDIITYAPYLISVITREGVMGLSGNLDTFYTHINEALPRSGMTAH